MNAMDLAFVWALFQLLSRGPRAWSENQLPVFAKTENHMLNNGKSANRNAHQNEQKNSQNRKTENPNASLYTGNMG